MICILKWLTSQDSLFVFVVSFLCVFFLLISTARVVSLWYEATKQHRRFKECLLTLTGIFFFVLLYASALIHCCRHLLHPPSSTSHALLPHFTQKFFPIFFVIVVRSPSARSHAHRLLNVTLYFNDNESKWWSRDKSAPSWDSRGFMRFMCEKWFRDIIRAKWERSLAWCDLTWGVFSLSVLVPVMYHLMAAQPKKSEKKSESTHAMVFNKMRFIHSASKLISQHSKLKRGKLFLKFISLTLNGFSDSDFR